MLARFAKRIFLTFSDLLLRSRLLRLLLNGKVLLKA